MSIRFNVNSNVLFVDLNFLINNLLKRVIKVRSVFGIAGIPNFLNLNTNMSEHNATKIREMCFSALLLLSNFHNVCVLNAELKMQYCNDVCMGSLD